MPLSPAPPSAPTPSPPRSAKAAWVYRARDTKLDRDVALTVLPHEEDLSGVHSLTETLHASIR